jgi:hypothetical protein
MKKIKITFTVAKIADYSLWTIATVFAFLVDWKAGVALLCFDAMRAFEDMQKFVTERDQFGKEAAAYQQGYDRGFSRGIEYEKNLTTAST